MEAIAEHPGAYASGVLDTMWQQLSEPYYRVVGGSAPPSRSPPRGDGRTSAPSEGQLIPGGQNLWVLRPDNAIRDVWTSATSFRFVFDRPDDRPRFEEIVRRRDELFAALPDRSGNATLALWLNRLSRWYPRPILWVGLGRRSRWRSGAPCARRRSSRSRPAALLVVLLNALGLGPDPHYVLPVAPAFVLFGLGALLGPRHEAAQA